MILMILFAIYSGGHLFRNTWIVLFSEYTEFVLYLGGVGYTKGWEGFKGIHKWEIGSDVQFDFHFRGSVVEHYFMLRFTIMYVEGSGYLGLKL